MNTNICRDFQICISVPLMESETAYMRKNKRFLIFNIFLFAVDDVKTNNLELYFPKVFRYKCFCKKLYFGYCNLSVYRDLLER